MGELKLPLRVPVEGMHMKAALHLFTLAALASASCTSLESAHNTHQAREYLTEDIEDQVVFNLVRARNGLPFAHYDVSNVQSIVGQKVSPSIGGSRSGVWNRYQPRLAVTSAMRAITRGLSAGLGGERNNTVTITIAPVFDKPAIYASYVRFLNLPFKSSGDTKDASYERIVESTDDSITEPSEKAVPGETSPSNLEIVERTEISKTVTKDEQGREIETTVKNRSEKPKPASKLFPRIRSGRIYSLVESPQKPRKGAYVTGTVRKWGDSWYYVPIQYKPEFSDLCLSLVARGDGGATGVQEETAKKLDLFNSQLQQQNTIQQTR
jgi:hypothetical protein